MITLHNQDEGTKANIKALPDGTFIIDMIAITEDSKEHVLWTYRLQTMEEAMGKVVGFITGQKSVVLREPYTVTIL